MSRILLADENPLAALKTTPLAATPRPAAIRLQAVHPPAAFSPAAPPPTALPPVAAPTPTRLRAITPLPASHPVTPASGKP